MSARTTSTRLLARVTRPQQALATPFARAASSSATASSSSSSSSSTSTFEPALPAGTSAAYDAALSFLSSHRSQSLAKLDRLRSRLNPSSPDAELLSRIDRLEIEAYANDPEVRRQFKATGGKDQFGRYIFRWLAEEQWKKEGGLDLLMQRVLQMNVVPDLLSEIPPTAPLALSSSSSSSSLEPGAFQPPSTFSSPPTLRFQPFHHPVLPTESDASPEALHTLLVIDPDSPSHETHSFTQRLHYLKTDIPLSVLSGQSNLFDSGLGKEVLSWEPPAPEQGTRQHRYVFLLFRQPASASSLPDSRENFDLRSYLSSNELSATDLVGINLFRAKWSAEEDEYINSVFAQYRGVEAAPVYGKVPKEVRYGYPLSAKRLRVEEARDAAWEKAVQEMEGLAEEVQGLAQQQSAEKVTV